MSLTTVATIGLGVGCDRTPQPSPPPAPATSVPVTTAQATQAAGPRVVFLGDSLTAGLGVEADQAFPAVLGRTLQARGLDATIVNAGVSGDTTAGGLRRLDWLFRQRPAIVVVCLGANDGLRGLDVDASAANLRQIVDRCRSAGADVLLLGMLIPTNYGPEYRERFAAIYRRLAEETGVPLVPFALEGVGGVPALNQPDGIHPTARGHEIVASNVIGPLSEIVERRRRSPPTP